MTFELVNPVTERQWNTWILDQEAATMFHSAEWAQVLLKTYGYPPLYGVVKDKQRVVAALPMMEVASVLTGRRGVSLPFTDECVPLLSNGVGIETLIDPILALGEQRKWDYLELRMSAEGVPGAVRTNEFILHSLTLEGSEELHFNKLTGSRRRSIRKAQQQDIQIHRLDTCDAMNAYYSLHCLTRQRHGLPPQPRCFFQFIYECIIASGHGFILLARSQGRWIAGAVYFHFGSRALYKFGASNPAFLHLRANSLLMWEAIRHFCSAGIIQLSLGRTDPQNKGLLQFKRSWGTEEVALPYYRIGLRKRMHSNSMNRDYASGLRVSMMKRMPIPLLRLLGILAYRHMG